MPIQFYNLIEIDFNLCGSSGTSIFEKYLIISRQLVIVTWIEQKKKTKLMTIFYANVENTAHLL